MLERMTDLVKRVCINGKLSIHALKRYTAGPFIGKGKYMDSAKCRDHHAHPPQKA